MLASKTFVKKTKKGAVVKIVREHYLRDDVWCGVIGCTLCKHQDKAPVIERSPVVVSNVCQYPHLILPDTNVALHQTDFLEDATITNAVILQTVLQEVSYEFLKTLHVLYNLTSPGQTPESQCPQTSTGYDLRHC